MIYVLPKNDENKKRSFFSKFKRKTTAFSEEEILLNESKHTLLFISDKYFNSPEFYRMLLPFSGQIIFHPSFVLGENFKQLSADSSEYKTICMFISFLDFVKSGCFKNTVLIISDESGYLYKEIPKLLMYIKGIRILTSSAVYNIEYTNKIYNEFGVKILISNDIKTFSDTSFCRVDFNCVTEKDELAFVFENRIYRLKPSIYKIKLDAEEINLFSKLESFGIPEDKLYNSKFLNNQNN